MGTPAARLGDPHSHGGTIVEASGNVLLNGLGVARVGDHVVCPLHGLQPIVSGSSTYRVNNRWVARVGSAVACGAVISGGSPSMNID